MEPPADMRRQAHQVLAAFRFQLLQTSLAWIGLSPGQTLLIEHIEDYDVIARDGGTTATQAKYSGSARSITLASAAATDALGKFWETSGRTTDRTLVVQTNLPIGLERGLSFPVGSPGIAYWDAVRQGAAAGPLREALLEALPDGALKTWLAAGPSEADFLDKLVRRVVWSTGVESGAELLASLTEQLVGRLNTLALPAGLANSLASQLTDHVFATATDKDPDLRKLDAAALNSFLVQASLSASGVAWALPPWATLTSAVELPQPCAPRGNVVTELATILGADASLWIHGASGCGKSTLALQIAAVADRPWLLVEFRELTNKRDVLLRLRRSYSDVVLAGKIAGVILDDLDADIVGADARRFGRFMRWARTRGLATILTSSRPCTPATGADLALQPHGIVTASYLGLEDVAHLALARDCPPDLAPKWAVYIYAATASGHPQLVAAKVISLSARGWPPSALTEDLIGPSSEAVALTRAEARRRLVLDAPEAGRALLRRLACIQGKFDRPLAVGAASVDPSIQESTVSLDLLIGPWIEAAPGSKKYLRLSPLLAGLNEDVPLEEATDTRLRVAYDVATRGPMDLEDLGIAFWNSVSAKSGWMLARLQLAFLSLSEDGFKAVAQELSALSYFRTDRPIFPDDPATSVTLRIIQVEVAAATDNSEVFRASTIAALQESSRFEDEELRSAFEVMVLMKALFARGVHVEWQLRLAWIAQFEELVARFPHLADEGSSPTLRQMRQEQGPDATISGFFVTIGGQTIQSVSDLEDLFNALQELEPALRTRRLRELRAFHRGYGLYVQQGWASAWFAGTLAADAALTTYERLADVALAWGDAELAAECLVAQTILMEEHLNRAEEALLRIDAALGQTPDGVILLRQKAKLLGHMNRYSEAAVILDALKAEIDKQSPVERMYALKEAAVAAGNTGSLRKAADLFEAAAAAVDGDLDAKLACHRIALRTEAALCCWKLGEHREALERYSRVLDLLPDIDPENSDTAKMLHLRVRFGAGWIEADVSRPFKTPPVLKIGAKAALDVDMTKIDRAISGPLEDIKLLLRAVALRLGLGDLFTSLELPRTTPDYHFVLRGAELDYAMIGMDGKTIAAAAVALLASIADLRVIHADNLPIGDDAATGTPEAIRILMAGIAMRVHVLGGLSNAWWDGFVDDCRGQFGLREIDLSDLKTADGTEGPSGDVAWNVMQGLFACRETKTPSERFEFHLNCVQAAMASAPAQSVINALIAIIRDDWAWSFGRQRFLLRQAEVGLAQFEEATRLVDQRAPGGLMALMQMAAFVLRTEFQPSWLAAFERVGGKRAA